MIDKSKLKEQARQLPPGPQAAILELLAELESARNAALEEAVEKLESMNDSAGDRASYDNRDMTCCETERMHALMQAVEAIRSLATTASTSAPAPSAKQEPSALIAAIGKLIATQDNRYTDQPMFIVQQRRRLYGLDSGYCENIIWLCSEDEHSEASEEEAAILEKEYQKTGIVKSGWTRTGYIDQWEFVTACFTEQGCKNYLARDGHNLKEPRIYAEGSYRNEEFRTIRNWLLSLAAPSAKQEPSADLSNIERKELDALREFAAGRCAIQQVIDTLGPMSLWSKAGFDAEVQRRFAGAGPVAGSQQVPEVLRELTDAADKFMAGEVVGLRAAIDKARAFLAAAPAVPVPAEQGWISVKDRLPELYVAVALLNEDWWMNTGCDAEINWQAAGWLCEFGQKCWSVIGEMRAMALDSVTHWMPLPAAPSLQQGKEGSQP